MRLRLALSGILAAVAGIAAGHLVAGFLAPASSPVLAIGSTVIDLTPTPVKEWAIATFGTNDKLILQGSVLVVTLVLAAVAGLLARRRMPLAVGLIVLLTGLAGAAALLRPAARPLDALPALAAMAVGVATLVWLARLAGASGDADRAAGLGAGRGADLGADLGARPGASRRGFVVGALGVTALSVLAAVGGQLRSGAQTIKKVVLPAAADKAKPLPAGLETKVPGISPFRTPTANFYRVDTNLTVPRVDVDSLDARDRRRRSSSPFTLTFDELLAMPMIERDITLTCVSNEVGGGYVGAARWLGVRLTDAARPRRRRASVRPDPQHRGRRLHHQHAARRRPRRPRRDDRRRHERRAAASAPTASPPGW